MPITVRQRSIHSKNNARRPTINKGRRKTSEGEYLISTGPTDLKSIAYPGGAVALGLLLAARLSSAYYGHISDCDETYNYWEPLHYLVYGKGLQTWEYSPAYAIRSYMSLWIFAIPAKILSLMMEPVAVFGSIRVLLAVLTACAELMFYKGICHEFGVHVGRVWLALALPAAGCFASSAAMLPSAWSGALVSAALASWWRRRYGAAVVLTAATTLLSWPFTVLLGLPIAIDLLIIKRQVLTFFKWSIISFIIIIVPTIAVDSWHYGKLVVAPWNIVAYNILTEHGPDLYGVEPWTYYFVNGVLNFNLVWPLALLSPLLLLSCDVALPRSTARAYFCAPYWLNLAPLVAWLAVFMAQPHKEERFLYPIYSLILLGGAISLDCIQKLWYAAGRRERGHYLATTIPLLVVCVAAAGLGGVSRIAALHSGYHGPMRLLSHLPPGDAPRNICFGSEWYRSPSHFHVSPADSIRFIKTSFTGQMPAPYAGGANATRVVHPHFNDQNKGDPRSYLPAGRCHFLVDTDLRPPGGEPAYYKDADWEVVAAVRILNAKKSHYIFRAFYVPFLSSKYNVYGNLYLLRNKLL